jgi:acyl-coenzyme A thioesterase PaaI-like protein
MHPTLKRHLRHIINFWPPFLAAGIRVTRLQPDWRAVDVEMKLHFWNTNFVGTHYGGSLYSMTDPFYMLMLIKNLGSGYIVWDKSASIRFRKPGKGRMRASFRLEEEQIEAIRRQLESQERVEPVFQVEVKNESGEVVAEVQKVLHVRKKVRNG